MHCIRRRSAAGKQAELLIDMQGPELRVGVLAEPMTLNEGEVLELGGKGIPLPEIAIPALLPGQGGAFG